jgi:hypothetical protein
MSRVRRDPQSILPRSARLEILAGHGANQFISATLETDLPQPPSDRRRAALSRARHSETLSFPAARPSDGDARADAAHDRRRRGGRASAKSQNYR